MRKVWSTLVVLGILLCMVMSMGVAADAAEGDMAIFAVSGAQFATENIEMIGSACPDNLVVDVDGLEEGQSAAGYSVVYADSESAAGAADCAYIWPGCAQMFQVGDQARCVVLVGVGEETLAEEVAAALDGYLGEDPYVIAVGPASAAAVVGGCADVDMFLTSGLEEGNGLEEADAACGEVELVNVGQNEESPVSMLTFSVDGAVSVQDIPVPAPVEDPGVGPEQTESTEAPAEPEPEAEPTEEPEPEAEPTICQIIYDGNGRTDGMVPDVLDFVAGGTHVLAQNGYVRDGYEFAGWTVDDDGTLYQPGEEVVIDHDVTIYAQWTEIASVPEEEPADEEDGADMAGEPVTIPVDMIAVTYKVGEGSGSDVTYPYNEKTGSVEITLPDKIGGFEAPVGKKLSGWMLESTGEVLDVLEQYTTTENVTFVAQYETVYTVTYDFGDSGNENYNDEVFAGEFYGLAAEPAVIPEGKTFAGWSVNGETKSPGEEIEVTDNILVTPLWADVQINSEPSVIDSVEITVTYKSGIEGMEDRTEETDANGSYQLIENPFTFPEDLVFVGWKQATVADGVVTVDPDAEMLDEMSEVSVGEEDLVFVAQTEAAPQDEETEEEPEEETEKDEVNPAITTDTLTFIQGADSTDPLEVSFYAQIDTVSVDNAALSISSQYDIVEEGDTSTVTFNRDYLNSLSVGDHTLNITFISTDTTDYTPYTNTLTVKAAPAEPTNEVKDIKQDWDRSVNLIIDFAQYDRGNPVKLELLRAYEKDDAGNYKKDENNNYIPVWKELTNGQDYTVNGTSMTLYPSLLGTWTNQQYGFRVTFDGAGTDKGATTMQLYLNVTGEVPKQAQSGTTTTNPTGSAGYVTGEGVNLRAGASLDSQVLRTVAKGTKITIYSITNGWASVSVDGVSGYMSANYVAYENAVPTATPNGAASPATGDTNNVTLYVVILVVLVIALAAVLIIVMKRRKQQ